MEISWVCTSNRLGHQPECWNYMYTDILVRCIILGGGGAKIIEYSSFHFPKDQLDLKKQCGEVYVYMCRIVLVR